MSYLLVYKPFGHMLLLCPAYVQFSFVDTDDCIGNPCGSNVCIDKLGGYECICTGGYSGSKCQIPPDFCSESACQHGGQCVNSIDNYACVCPYGFHGMFCESKAGNYFFPT